MTEIEKAIDELNKNHTGHQVSFSLDESGHFDAVENHKFSTEEVVLLECKTCNIVLFKKE